MYGTVSLPPLCMPYIALYGTVSATLPYLLGTTLVHLPSLCMVHNSPTTSTLTPRYYLPCRLRIRTTHFTYTQFLVEIVLSRYLSTISLSQYYLTLLLQFFSIQPSSHASYYLFPALYQSSRPLFPVFIQTKKVKTWGDLLPNATEKCFGMPGL